MTKVLVIGKGNCLVRMTENTVEAFRQAGCETAYFPVNGLARLYQFYFKWRGKLVGDQNEIVAERLEKTIKRFQPHLIIFVLGAWQNERIYQIARNASPTALVAAWVGDVFQQEESVFARYMDWVFCTDSHFMHLLKECGSAVPASYLPLAMDPQQFFPKDVTRNNKIVYVAKLSPGRAAFINSVQRPLALYGKKWKKLHTSQHEIHSHHLPPEKLPALYASSCAVLNLKNELNVVHGLNQRSFEPYGCKTPVLNDDVPDIERCFDPGTEILIYRSVDELHAWHDRLTGDRAFARAIGDTGYKRVMAEHTYAHRAQDMLRKLGLEKNEFLKVCT